jgi:uncharacterized protein YjiS (DUF1127 family)
MLKYFGFVPVASAAVHKFSACDAEYTAIRARRADAAAARAADREVRPSAVVSLLNWLTTVYQPATTRQDRTFWQNVNNLSRLSPHLLDDIGILPQDAPNPLVALRARIADMDTRHAEAERIADQDASVSTRRASAGRLVAVSAH